MYQQHAPYSIHMEMTEGCNLRCTFCGIHGIRTAERVYYYMETATAEIIAAEMARAGWNLRLEFAMRGEPTKNPHALEIIAIFRKHLPGCYFLMETNGSGFLASTPKKVTNRILEFFAAGLDTVAIDEYHNIPWAEVSRQAVRTHSLHGIQCYEYPAQAAGNPHRRSAEKRFVIIAPIDTSTRGTHSANFVLCNHCGAGGPLNNRGVGRICAHPFRELAVRYNGDMAICCNDWRGVFKVGNAVQTSISDLWHSPALYAARRKLLRGERTFPPCLGCDARSYRVGLLPDPTGQEDYPPADAECDAEIQKALVGGPFTHPVLRPWETGTDNYIRIGGVNVKTLV